MSTTKAPVSPFAAVVRERLRRANEFALLENVSIEEANKLLARREKAMHLPMLILAGAGALALIGLNASHAASCMK